MSVLWPNGQRDHTRGICHVVTEGHFKGLCVYAWAYTCPIWGEDGKTGWECYKSMMCCTVEKLLFLLSSASRPIIKANNLLNHSHACWFILFQLSIFPPPPRLCTLFEIIVFFCWSFSIALLFVFLSCKKVSIKKSFHGIHLYLYYLVFLFKV